MSFLKSMLSPPIRSANHETLDSDGGQKRAAVPRHSTACEIRRGNINRDASRAGKASGEFMWPMRGDDELEHD